MEDFSKTINKHETQEGEPVADLEAAASQLDTHATILEREGGEVDISEETVERIEKKVGKIRNLLKAASMGLALYGTYEVGSYATSRYEITTEVGQDGGVEYQHEDPETTRILNFLTGKSELSPEDRIHFYRQEVRNTHERLLSLEVNAEYGLDEKNAFEESMPDDEQGLREYMGDLLQKLATIVGDSVAPDEIEKRVNMFFAHAIDPKVRYSPELEKLVWNMQKKVGAPRLRWAASTDNLHSKLHGSLSGPGRANYSEEDNTVYITPGAFDETLGKTLLAENAHAFQFNENPVTSRVRYAVDTAKTLASMLRDNKSYYEAQHEQYQTLGSIEQEAHEIIEQRLTDEGLEEEKRERGK